MLLNSKFNNFEFNNPELAKDLLLKFNNFEFNNPELAKDLLLKFNNFEFNDPNLIILNSMTKI